METSKVDRHRHNSLGFQKDLIVWKLRNMPDNIVCMVSVSEGLNSVETSKMENCYIDRHKVSEGLNSVETCFANNDFFYWSLRFRRT